MSGDLYSQQKIAFHPDRIADFRAGKRPKPIHVQLILSDLCNQDCGFCAYRSSVGLSSELFAAGELAKVGHNNPVRRIPTPKAREIIEDCASIGVKAIQFTGGGEPTVHPDHIPLMGLAQSFGMETALVTNGVRLNPNAPEMLKHAWLRVSIDAGDEDMYRAVRRVPEGHWSKAWQNISILAKNNFAGVLGVGYVVTPQNYTGIYECARRAKDAGAQYVRLSAVFSAEGRSYYGSLDIADVARSIEAYQRGLNGDGFELIDLFSRRMDDLDAKSPTEAFCGVQYVTVYIGGDQNVYRCCNTAYTEAGKVGSLQDQRFRDLWKLAYEPFDARECRFCQFQGQNKAIAGLLKEPTHVNFV